MDYILKRFFTFHKIMTRAPRCFVMLLVMVTTAALIFPETAAAFFYQYVDNKGRQHFVDDIYQVPEIYLDQLKVHKESQSKLQQKETERLQAQQEAELDGIIRSYELELDKASQKRLNTNHETPVTIYKNQVLVPVTIGYGGSEFEATLLLDTGAGITTLHSEIAKELAFKNSKRAFARVAGGNRISFNIIKLDYIRVGPYQRNNISAGIVRHSGGKVLHQGLLGMNFLRHFPYRVDFKKQVLLWGP